MSILKSDDWKSIEIRSLALDVLAAVESGEIDSAFDAADLSSGTFSRTKSARNLTKNYFLACLRAGVDGISEARYETALCLLNAFRRMNSEISLEQLPDDYKVYAIRLPHPEGNPDIEIYIKQGTRVLYGEKIFPPGALTENFLALAEAGL
jgi:hypothetical protein